MFGGTPSNLAVTFLVPDRVEVVTGVNLPMLLKLATLREAAGPARDRAHGPRARPRAPCGWSRICWRAASRDR